MFHLEEYEAALQAFEKGLQLAPDMGPLKTWCRKCQAEIEGECWHIVVATMTTTSNYHYCYRLVVELSTVEQQVQRSTSVQ